MPASSVIPTLACTIGPGPLNPVLVASRRFKNTGMIPCACLLEMLIPEYVLISPHEPTGSRAWIRSWDLCSLMATQAVRTHSATEAGFNNLVGIIFIYSESTTLLIRKPTRSERVKSDASARPATLTSVFCYIDFGLLTSEVERFMPLPYGPLVPVCSKIGSVVFTA